MKKLNPYVANIVGEYQCDFRKGKSTIDNTHTILHIVEKHYEYNNDLHLVFIDFKQVYNSINRQELWKTIKLIIILQYYNIGLLLLIILQK